MKTNPGSPASRYGRVTLAAAALALVMLLAALGCGPSGQGGVAFWQETDSGYPAPDFTLFDLEGNEVAISDYRGNVVLVHFWATWCPACRDSMPAIQEFYQEHEAEGVEVIGIAPFESEGKARDFVRQGGYGWTFAVDPSGVVTRDYGVFVLPTTFLVDQDGLVRAVSIAPAAKSALDGKLAELVAEPRL